MSCYRLIDAEKAHHPVSQLARVLGVARAGYYAWACRPPSDRSRSDALLGEQIRQIHDRSRGTYGAPRIHAELRLGLGVHVSRKRVARIMCEHGLQGVHRRRRGGLTRRDPAATPAPDLVQRRFAPPGPISSGSPTLPSSAPTWSWTPWRWPSASDNHHPAWSATPTTAATTPRSPTAAACTPPASSLPWARSG